MSDKQAPPLGNLTRGEQPTNKPLPKPVLPTAKPESTVPVGTERVYSAPGVPNTYDFSKVGGEAGDALASYATQRNDATPIPMVRTLDSRPEMPVSDVMLNQLAGDESTPFNYTGIGGGVVGREQVQLQPTAGIAKYDSQVGQPIANPLAVKGVADAIIANQRPVESFQWSEGLTQSQRNSRNFFNGLQEFRQQIAPSQLPALQFTPQQLNPGVAGGFAPTAETKGPLSWLVDGQQKDFNPLKGEFGGYGGGILGGVGWLFSRLSPTTYIQGAALDVSRNAASIIEGGAAGLTELFKSGDFGKAYNEGLDAAYENFTANAPRTRGLTQQTIFGSKELGDFFSNSYTGTAIAGMADYSFSGTGNNPLITGDASYGVVNKGDNFNPFGFRDPIRSGFNTGALEAQERIKANAAWNANPYRALPGNPLHGYDQWLAGGAGLLVDIFGSGRIDSLAKKAVKATTVTRNGDDLAAGIAALRSPSNNPARYIPSPPGALVPLAKVSQREVPDISAFLPNVQPSKAGSLTVPTAKPLSSSGITQVVQGEFVEETAAITRRNMGRTDSYSPITQRYLPQGADPFSVSSTRPYTPVPTNIDYSAGGAIVPYSGKQAAVVPAVLGVGGTPSSVPVSTLVKSGLTKLDDVPATTVWDDITQSFVTVGKSSPSKVPLPSVGKNVPELPQTPLPGPARPLSEAISDVPPKNYAVLQPPPLVPKNTPNFTVQPSAVTDDAIRTTHTVNEATGTFVNTTEQATITLRKSDTTPPRLGDLPETVVPPAKEVQYVTAEAISPSVTSADIVRRLTSGDDIPGAVYNPRQVERQTRSIQSVVSLARQVTLPNGVRILDDTIKDVSVMKFSRLQKKVEAAIISSGMNPASTEAASIRRLFDRNGKPLPSNLAPDFSIEVAGRTLDTPTTYVKPATQVADGNVTWTGRAARYTPTYELSGDYAIGVKVKYDDDLKRIVPVDGMDAKMSPPVKTEQAGVISRSALLDMPVADRQSLVAKSYVDGYDVPKGAVADVVAPDILTDTMAAKSYAQANLPRESVPPRMDRAARTELAKHADLVEEAAYTRELITDVSTQLTDVERSLNQYLKKVDELPDIGVSPLTDDVPFSSLIKRETIRPVLSDVEDIIVKDGVSLVDNTVPIVTQDGLQQFNLAGGKLNGSTRLSVTVVTEAQLPYALRQFDTFADDFKGLVHDGSKLPQILDVESLSGVPSAKMSIQQLQETFESGAFMTPVVQLQSDGTYKVLRGAQYVSEYKAAISASGNSLVDRMSVVILPPAKPRIDTPPLYHGTRVADLNLRSVDPLEGAARSEYGTGVWLTNSQEIATSASGRAVPANSVPNVSRQFGDESFIHELPGNVLDDMNIPRADSVPSAKVTQDVLTQLDNNRFVFSDVVPYGDDLTDELVNLLESGKVSSYTDLFSKVDDLTHKVARRNTGAKPDEYELTYVQRVLTDMLQGSGVQGLTNGVNTVMYDTRNLTSKYIHNVTDIVGDSADEVTTALHNVNLLQRSLDAEPNSKLLQVQLAEAKAVATSRVRDSLSDELDLLGQIQSKQISDLLDQDEVVSRLAKQQRSEELIRATLKDEATVESFTKELNRSDWTGPCL